MSYQIYLNGELVAQPKDWDGYQQEIVRDFEKRFVRIAYPGTFRLTNASGYQRLRQIFLSDMCTIVKFEAYEVCGSRSYQLVSGGIVLTDCKWNLDECTVEAPVQDDAIGERLDNNIRIPVSPQAENSKNGFVIEPCQLLPIEVYDPQAPEPDYLPTTRGMFDWMDMMQHCVRYMTDSNVSIVSEWYEALPLNQRIAIVSGYQLRTGDIAANSARLTYDFKTLFGEIARRYNLWVGVRRDDGGEYYLAVEPEPAMFNPQMAFEMLYQPGLEQSIVSDQMYSAVEVGDEDGIQNLDLQYSLPYIVLQGFSREKFHFQGICNADNILDLTGKWKADTNTIEKVVVTDTTSDDYDKDVFIVQYDAYLMKAVKGDYLSTGSTPYLYNEQMLNINILNRYTLPSDVGAFFNTQDTGFKASGYGPSFNGRIFAPPFIGCYNYLFTGLVDDDVTSSGNFNPSNSWNIALQRFEAPTQGYYELEAYARWSTTNNHPRSQQSGCNVLFERFDSSDTLLGSEVRGLNSGFSSGTYEGTASAGFILNAGDYVTRTFRRFVCNGGYNTGDTVTINMYQHYTRTKLIVAGGGVLTSVDPDGARIVQYDFDRLIPISKWQELINDPRQGVGVSEGVGPVRASHIMKATRDVVSGKTSFTTIAPRRSLL